MAIGRSENMRRIKGKHTRPEIIVRSLLRKLGYTGYRIHRKDLPGTPDIAFIGKRKAILVHGCFWHGHDCKEGIRKPKSNLDYWEPKIERNRLRDLQHQTTLVSHGWSLLIIWECELKNTEEVSEKLVEFMSVEQVSHQTDRVKL